MIYHGDLFDVLPTLGPESIHACVTDPPYGIGFMGKKWDTFNPTALSENDSKLFQMEAGAHQHGRNPFDPANVKAAAEMKQRKDPQLFANQNIKGRVRSPALSPSQIEYDRSLVGQREFQAWTQAWAEQVWRVLKPGGYLLVCGAPRSFHRMACGLEDAGFVVRDCLSWLFGQGFPKSLNISKAIDKEARGVPQGGSDPTSPNHGRYKGGCSADNPSGRGFGAGPGQFMAETGEQDVRELVSEAQQWVGFGTALKPSWEPIIVARKPLNGTVAENVLKHGTGGLNIDGCRLEGGLRSWREQTDEKVPSKGIYGEGLQGSRAVAETDLGRWPANVVVDEEAAALVDEQAGELTGPGSPATCGSATAWPGGQYQGRIYPNEIGGASRFYYVAKPSRAERDMGCEGLPARTGGEATDRQDGTAGVNNPRAGAGRTGGARNYHPTVKPLALMRWLVRLVTPPGGVVLDPFLGSGTTLMACRYEGFEGIGVEREAEYVAIAERRIAAAAPLLAAMMTPEEEDQADEQMPLL